MHHGGRKRVLLALAWQYESLALSVAGHAQRAGWHLDLQMYTTGEVPKAWRGEGIIALLGGRRDLSRFIRQTCVPTVCLTLNEPELALPRIDIDSAAMGRLAAEHFLEKRFTAFAWYSHGRQVVEHVRCEEFAGRLHEAGHDCRRLIWREARGKRADTWANRQEWLARMLARLPHPLAVFSTDDTTAVEVIEACLRVGLDLPEQVAVLGAGNLELYRSSTPVPLSSIATDFERLAFESTRLLAELMAGGGAPREPMLLPPGGIVARRSTDTIAVEHPEVALAVRFLLCHYHEPLGAKEVVAATTSSQTSLYAAFREELGASPMAVLRGIRLEKAKQMLRETDQKIRSVAKACGFGEAINLYRLLLNDCGMTPKEYRGR